MQKEDIDAICETVRNVVNSKGACGIRWAINQHYGYDLMREPAPHKAQKIIGSIIKSNEYISTLSNVDGYYIYRNPAHPLYLEQKEFTKKQINISKLIAFITVLNLLFVGISIYQALNSKTDKELNRLSAQSEILNSNVARIKASIDSLNQTISRAQNTKTEDKGSSEK